MLFIDLFKFKPECTAFTNSTFYNIATAGRDFIRHDAAEANYPDVTTGPAYKIDHCTLYNIGAGANRRLFYLRFADNTITFTNNIIAEVTMQRGFTDQTTTCQTPELKKNYYYNTKNLVSAGDNANDKIRWFDPKGTELSADPFKNAAAYDFTLTNDAIKKQGDPRWAK